ncbi:MAG: hypothetical protein H6707_18830 [Deltaproteobacteria bacterium]|nr:hypothetical protein [Deltaproteobacteria bacterium]
MRRFYLPIALVIYIASALLLHPQLLGNERFLGWDAVNEHWGVVVYGRNYLQAGELPLWTPHERAGHSLIGDPQSGVTYPGNLLFYLGALFGFDGPGVMLLHWLFHLAVAALGMHVLLRRRRTPHAVAVFGGLSFVLSARLAKCKDQSTLWSAAWLPWMLIAVEDHAERPSLKSAAALGIVTALCLLGGYTPNFFRNLLVVLPVFIVALAVHIKRDPRRRRYLTRVVTFAALAIAVFAALVLPAVLGVIELFPHTTRTGLAVADVLRSAVRPQDALGIFGYWKDPASPSSVYMGLATGLLLLVSLTVKFRLRRLLWLAIAGVFFLLACGGNAFLLPMLVKKLSVFALFRVPEQYAIGTVFGVAVLAALALADLVSISGKPARRAGWLLLFFGLGLLLLLVLAPRPAISPGGRWHPSQVALVLLAPTVGLLWLITRLPLRYRPRLVFALVALLLVDLGIQLRPIYDILDRRPDTSDEVAKLAALEGIRRDVRFANDGYIHYRLGLRHGVRELYGRRNMLMTRRYARFFDVSRTSYPLLAAANVRYHGGRFTHQIRSQAGALAKPLAHNLTELKEYAPHVAWYDSVRLLAGEAQVLSQMKAGAARRMALVALSDLTAQQRSRLAGLAGGQRMVAGRVLAFGLNSMTFEIDAPAPGVVVVNEAYSTGWKAVRNGAEEALFPVNYLFRGLYVPAGRHHYKLSFSPPGVRLAFVGYGMVVLLLVGCAIGYRCRRLKCRRSRRSADAVSIAPQRE